MQRDIPRGQAQAVSPDSVSGLGDARLQFALVLRDGVKAKDVPMTIQGAFTKLNAQNIGAGQKLESAQLSFAVAAGVLTGKGEGRFAGAPATIELRKEQGDAAPQLRLAMTLDDASRTRLGLHAGKAITGPMPVKITPAADPGGPAAGFDVEADLTRTAINGVIPGLDEARRQGRQAQFQVEPWR